MSEAHYVGCAIWAGGECDCKHRNPEVFCGQDIEAQLSEAQTEIERLRGLVDACSIYLKEDETPAQRIERERADTEAVLKLLVKEKRDNERLREGERAADDEIERLRQQVTQRGARMQVMRAYLTSYSGPSTTLWRDFCRVRPEAAEWFDEEGVPR